MKNLKQNSLVLAIVMLFAFTANAQQGNQNNGNKARQGQGQCYKQKQCNQNKGNGFYLDLSDEQKTQMDELRLNHQKKILPLRNELGEKKAKMKSLSTAEKVDMKAINALIDEIGAIKTQMAKEKAAHRQQIRNILTEEQRMKFDLHQGKRGNGHGNCPGKGKGVGRS